MESWSTTTRYVYSMTNIESFFYAATNLQMDWLKLVGQHILYPIGYTLRSTSKQAWSFQVFSELHMFLHEVSKQTEEI